VRFANAAFSYLSGTFSVIAAASRSNVSPWASRTSASSEKPCDRFSALVVAPRTIDLTDTQLRGREQEALAPPLPVVCVVLE
jgi:hypothetical protein